MALSTNDLGKLIELLREHPHWKEQLRAVLLSEELLRLPEAVRELVEVNRKMQERLSGVEERVARLEAAVERLAEAQRRSDERLTSLEAALERLAEAQRRTEQRVEELAEAQRKTDLQIAALAKQVGSLANIVGADIEEDASDVLRHVLRQKGWKLLANPTPISVDGEVDVAAPVEDPNGQRLWILVEVKLRLRRKEVYDWHRQLEDPGFRQRLRDEGLGGAFLPYAFGIRVYDDAAVAAGEVGMGLLDVRGERTSPLPRHL